MTKNGTAVYEAIGAARWELAYLTGWCEASDDKAVRALEPRLTKALDLIRTAHNLAVTA